MDAVGREAAASVEDYVVSKTAAEGEPPPPLMITRVSPPHPRTHLRPNPRTKPKHRPKSLASCVTAVAPVLVVLGSGNMTLRQILRAVGGVLEFLGSGVLEFPGDQLIVKEKKNHLFDNMELWTFANPTELHGYKDTSSHS